MAVLNLRGLPKELVARVKAQAALDGETILQWVRRVLEAQFGAEAGVSVKARTAEVKTPNPAPREVDEGGVQRNGVAINGREDRRLRMAGGRILENPTGTGSGLDSASEGSGRRRVAKAVSKQMTAEEFMTLSSSEQLRARREGKF